MNPKTNTPSSLVKREGNQHQKQKSLPAAQTASEAEDQEKWIEVSVSNHGRLKINGRILPQCRTGKQAAKGGGYYATRIGDKIKVAHRLVAAAFVPNQHSLPQVNHIDGNSLNNKASNLEWCSNWQNVAHAELSGLANHPKGSQVATAKLNEEKAKYIFSRKGIQSANSLSKEMNIGRSQIARIFNLTSWRHVNV